MFAVSHRRHYRPAILGHLLGADHALFVGWGEVVSDREQRAAEVFAEFLEFYGRMRRRPGPDRPPPCRKAAWSFSRLLKKPFRGRW